MDMKPRSGYPYAEFMARMNLKSGRQVEVSALLCWKDNLYTPERWVHCIPGWIIVLFLTLQT